MFGNLTEDAIEEILGQQFIGRIGCNFNDVTYVVPISYVYDGVCVYAHAEEGMKLNMMRQNPNVCFEIDTMEKIGNWQSVISWGTYEEVTDENERAAALKMLLNRPVPMSASKTAHLTPNWPFHAKNLNEIKGVVFRIKLHIKTGRFESTDEVSYGLA